MKHLMLLLLVFGLGTAHAQTVDPCRADIDRSGEVDFRDFQLLVDAYGTSKCGLYWLGEDIRLTNWDTLIVRDTIVVRDTLVVRETVRDTVLVIEREQPGPVEPGAEQPQPPLPAPSNTTTTEQPPPEQPQPPLPAPSDTTTTEQPPPEQPQPPLPAPSDTTTTEQPQPEQQWPGVSLVCSSETRAVLEVYENIFTAHGAEDTDPPRGSLRSFLEGAPLQGDSIRVTEETAVADFDNDGFISREHHPSFYHDSDYGQYLLSLYHILAEDPRFGRIPYLDDSWVHHRGSPHAMFHYHVFGRPNYLSRGGRPRFAIAPPTEVIDGSPNGVRERGRDYPPAYHSFCGHADRYIRLGEY